MGEINLNDFVEVDGKVVHPGWADDRRPFTWQGEILVDRKKYVLIEDQDGNPFTFLKKDIKSIKKIKKYENVI